MRLKIRNEACFLPRHPRADRRFFQGREFLENIHIQAAQECFGLAHVYSSEEDAELDRSCLMASLVVGCGTVSDHDPRCSQPIDRGLVEADLMLFLAEGAAAGGKVNEAVWYLDQVSKKLVDPACGGTEEVKAILTAESVAVLDRLRTTPLELGTELYELIPRTEKRQ